MAPPTSHTSYNTNPNQLIYRRAPFLQQPIVDLGMPNYDRSTAEGNFILAALQDGKVNFSDYCPSYARALAMSRLSKHDPTWVFSGLQKELEAMRLSCSVKGDWLTAKMVQNLLLTQLGTTTQIIATFNVNPP